MNEKLLMKTLEIICPVYNEQEVIKSFYESLSQTLFSLKNKYEISILFVVDKSTDKTPEILSKIAKKDKSVKVLFLSKRFGHQMSLVAGIDHSKADILIMMDSDLQHPPELIPDLLTLYQAGYDIVTTVRKEPLDKSLLKRLGSKLFYKVINLISEIELSSGEADFRLISRKVADTFSRNIRENNQFLRGLFSWVGFEKTSIEYDARPRESGSSKYSYSRIFKFASSGIISFSKKPLHYAFYFGFIFFCISLILILFSLYTFLTDSSIPSGFTTISILISFFGGMQLLFIGVLGEYLGYVFDEVKSRPIYIVDEKINIE